MATLIDTLEKQPIPNIDRWLRAVLRNYFVQLDQEKINEYVYLPYSGNDTDLIITIFEKYLLLKYPDHHFDEIEKPVVRSLAEVTTGISEKRGVVISGPVGAGKTELLRYWMEFRLRILAPKGVASGIKNYDEILRIKKPRLTVLTSREVRTHFLETGFSFFEKIEGDILFIDDLGLGSMANYYGDKVNAVEEVILSWYDRAKYHPNIEFYATTNLSRQDIKKSFNLRTYSRLWELVEWITYGGVDRRKDGKCTSNWPELLKNSNPTYRPDKW